MTILGGKNGDNGDDVVRIDESNGVFTDTIPTTIDGGNGDDNLVGGAGAVTLWAATGTTPWPEAPEPRRCSAATATTRSTATEATTSGLLGNGDDTFVWDPGDGSDIVEGQNGPDTMLFNGANGAEHVDLSANGSGSGSSAPRQHHDGHRTASSESTSTPSAAPTSSLSTT